MPKGAPTDSLVIDRLKLFSIYQSLDDDRAISYETIKQWIVFVTVSLNRSRIQDHSILVYFLIAIVWSWLALVRHFPIQFVPHVTSLSSQSKEMDRWIPDKYIEPVSNTWRRHVIEDEFYKERTRFIFELTAIRHSCFCYLTSAATHDHHLGCVIAGQWCAPRVFHLAIISDIHLI